jgi:uncharacterized membrane protein
MPLWLIPMVYTLGSALAALTLPRLESAFLPGLTHGMSVSAALTLFGAVGSGMMALTGIVFAITFVMVQFNAAAYSPRLVLVVGSSPLLFHTLGLFFATFTYSLAAIAWTDRNGSGEVPLVSALLVGALLLASMIAFARVIQSLSSLQIQAVLELLGDAGRAVIDDMFPRAAGATEPGAGAAGAAGPAGPDASAAPVQTLVYSGKPRAIAHFDIAALVEVARAGDAVVAMECGVGDTLVADGVLLRVYGRAPLSEAALRAAVRLSSSRTFEQDPKYPIRLLVDIAIRALSPAVNDPTTAVQALDQIEDLLRRLGRRELDTGQGYDAQGVLRLTFPVPSWSDYLSLAVDEIRVYGAGSVQVARRLRAVLTGLLDDVATEARREQVRRYLAHLNLTVEKSPLDPEDQAMALQEDRQGLGLPHRRPAPPSVAEA